MGNIEIRGAKENNLKNISIDIKKNEITVVTGVSGSGKSSLVFDTVYAESERMFLDSMSVNSIGISSYLKKPDVDKINNLLPAIAISQKQTNRNPRSTVGTVTDISQFIRLLFAKIATVDTKKLWTEGDFSYNNPKAWCDTCNGTGEEYVIDNNKIIDVNKSINDGALIYWNEVNKDYYSKLMKQISQYYNINLDIKLNNMDKQQLDFILNGISECEFTIRYKNYKNKYRSKSVKFVGMLKDIKEKLNDINTPSTFKSIEKFLKKTTCSKCKGSRLKHELLEFRIYGANIFDLQLMTLSELKNWVLKNENSNDNCSIEDKIFKQVSPEIVKRIENLEKLKLGYLTLDRSIPSLSGGESQRIRLANQLSSELSGLLYVLDEPTMGLHVNDISNINDILNKLKQKGNTILVVEHNAEVMLNADNIIDIGPKGGKDGGKIIFSGSPQQLIKQNSTDTSIYLNEYKNNCRDICKKKDNSKFISICGATYNNIVNQDFNIPINEFTVITGVSGSGKSTFIKYILEPSLISNNNINCKSIHGNEYINKIIKVDQTPIGRSPKSNVATYTGMFDFIRDIYSKTEEAKKKKISKSNFSFNVDGGRCENCKGDGIIKIDMSFMPETYIECTECHGKRYKNEILNIKYNGKDISEVLNMTVIEAFEFFKSSKKIINILKCLIDVGLDYIKIGQSALTISGGEAQRVKLAKYLSDHTSKNNIYILDEPSIGLHHTDVKKLIELMHNIVEKGNTLITVEHNIEIIRSADYIIDMGLNGGPLGGKVIDMGSICEIKNRSKASIVNIL